MRLGLDLTPPDKREDALLFRRSVGAAFAGFIRSQLVLGALYGLWAFVVSFCSGCRSAPATAFLSGLIMAIPIYGPYVSWLPPVLVALLFEPDVAFLVAIVMLVGWFIDENILAPLVRAGALELHPIVVTFAFLLGAQLAGAIGAHRRDPAGGGRPGVPGEVHRAISTKRGWPEPDAESDAEGAPPGVPATKPETAKLIREVVSRRRAPSGAWRSGALADHQLRRELDAGLAGLLAAAIAGRARRRRRPSRPAAGGRSSAAGRPIAPPAGRRSRRRSGPRGCAAAPRGPPGRRRGPGGRCRRRSPSAVGQAQQRAALLDALLDLELAVADELADRSGTPAASIAAR